MDADLNVPGKRSFKKAQHPQIKPPGGGESQILAPTHLIASYGHSEISGTRAKPSRVSRAFCVIRAAGV
jgi:hypothetical protein